MEASEEKQPEHGLETPPSATMSRFVCPFCGEPAASDIACDACGARTDPLSRQATQNEMGPWFVRDAAHPHRPGCRLETIERWARSGKLTPETVLRGPSTAQNWAPARRVPGIARLFGRCHACAGSVEADEISCRTCGADLHAERDRQHLGLSPVRELPGRGDPVLVADRLLFNEPKHLGSAAVNPEAMTRARDVGGEGVSLTESPVGRPAREAELARRLASARRRGWVAIAVAACLLGVSAVLVYNAQAGPSARATPNDAVSHRDGTPTGSVGPGADPSPNDVNGQD